jgi:hypothetical protein
MTLFSEAAGQEEGGVKCAKTPVLRMFALGTLEIRMTL